MAQISMEIMHLPGSVPRGNQHLANTSPFQGMAFLQKRFPRLHYVRFKTKAEREEMQTAIAAELGVDLAEI
jgi:transketolase